MNVEFALAEIRVSVAILGETHGWWKTNFFAESSESFFEYDFPRLKTANQIIACEAAKTLLDLKIGASYFHLYRLSIQFEEGIHKNLLQGKVKIKTEEDATKTLHKFASGLTIDRAPGPKNIGNIDHLDLDLVQAFAAEYLNAFDNNYQTYPYLN